MMATLACLALDGTQVVDGQAMVITVQHGGPSGHERTYMGVIRAFHDDEGEHWEISQPDPIHPAVGFLPENLLSAKTVPAE